jgi:hypothetical protein
MAKKKTTKKTTKKITKKAPQKRVTTFTRYFIHESRNDTGKRYYSSDRAFAIEDKEETRQQSWGGTIEKRKIVKIKNANGRPPSGSICGWGVRGALGRQLCPANTQCKVTLTVEILK